MADDDEEKSWGEQMLDIYRAESVDLKEAQAARMQFLKQLREQRDEASFRDVVVETLRHLLDQDIAHREMARDGTQVVATIIDNVDQNVVDLYERLPEGDEEDSQLTTEHANLLKEVLIGVIGMVEQQENASAEARALAEKAGKALSLVRDLELVDDLDEEDGGEEETKH